MRNVIYLFFLFTILVFASVYFWGSNSGNTRKLMAQQRRLSMNNRTILSKKHAYFKQAFQDFNSDNQGIVAYNMNLLENEYNIPYCWGGDIRNFKQGLDCSGFIHGLMYYSGETGYKKRFNTASLYRKLKSDKNYLKVHITKSTDGHIDLKNLRIGDVILWPSGIADGRNISGDIIGHVGIVSKIIDTVPYVTHYVDAPKYNDVDFIGRSGAGINTINAYDFIAFKERGQLNIFRKKQS